MSSTSSSLRIRRIAIDTATGTVLDPDGLVEAEVDEDLAELLSSSDSFASHWGRERGVPLVAAPQASRIPALPLRQRLRLLAWPGLLLLALVGASTALSSIALLLLMLEWGLAISQAAVLSVVCAVALTSALASTAHAVHARAGVLDGAAEPRR